MSITYTASGYYDVSLPVGDRRIYVRNGGSDAADGLTTGTAKATIASARTLLRAGTSDRVAIRRGDTFTTTFSHNTSGRSATEPLIILEAYSDGTAGHTDADPRPIVVGGLNIFGGSNIAVLSVDFVSNGTNDGGIVVNATGSNLLVDDCRATGYYQGFIGTGSLGSPYRNQTWNKCTAVDSDGSHGQGWYLGNFGSGTHKFWDCTAVNCGFPDNLSHCAYLDKGVEGSCSPDVRRFIAWPDYPTGGVSTTSEGLKCRQGGIGYDCHIAFCAIGMTWGTTEGDGSDFATIGTPSMDIQNCIITYGSDTPSAPYGYGLWVFGITDTGAHPIKNCGFVHTMSTGNERSCIVFVRWRTSTTGRVFNALMNGCVSYNFGRVRYDDVQGGYSGHAFANMKIRETGNFAPLIEHTQNTATTTTFVERHDNSLWSAAATGQWISAPTGNNLTAYGAVSAGSAGAGLPDPGRDYIGMLAANGVTVGTPQEAHAYIKDKVKNRRRYMDDADYSATSMNDWFRAGLGIPLVNPDVPTPTVVSPSYYVSYVEGAA